MRLHFIRNCLTFRFMIFLLLLLFDSAYNNHYIDEIIMYRKKKHSFANIIVPFLFRRIVQTDSDVEVISDGFIQFV